MTIENRDNLGLIDDQIVFGMRLQGLAKASLGNGVVAESTTSTALKASQRAAVANMSVDVATGSCQIDGVVYTEDSIVNVVISAAHATDERIDLIVYDQSAGNPAVVTGTANATNPRVPDVTDDKDIPLALVYVLPQDDVAYSGTITTEYIYDVRCFMVFIASVLQGSIEFPLYLNTHEAYGSNFSTISTTYVYCGKLVVAIPTFYPTTTKTITAKFHVIISLNTIGAEAATCQLYNLTTSTSISELSSTDVGGEPYLKTSTSLTVGTGKNIVDGNTYLIRAKTTAGTCAVYRAWLEFYWG